MDALHSRPIAGSVADPIRYSDRTMHSAADRIRAIVVVALLHVLLIWLILHGLAGKSAPADANGQSQPLQVYKVPATPAQPPPKPAQKRPAATSAPPARLAKSTARVVPKHLLDIALPVASAPIESSGSASMSGAAAAGGGTGAGGAGSGTGNGAGGNGSGGGVAVRAVKVSGDINSARDYPPDRDGRRLGSSVTLALTIQVDGRVGGCRVLRPSVDPVADAVTCRLATQRFHFRPATNAAGQPIESTFGWKQSWFRPDVSSELNP
jgi:protein TonB